MHCRYQDIFLINSQDRYKANDTSLGPLGQHLLYILAKKQVQKSKIFYFDKCSEDVQITGFYPDQYFCSY